MKTERSRTTGGGGSSTALAGLQGLIVPEEARHSFVLFFLAEIARNAV